MEKIIYPPWISKKMKVRFDNLLLCIDASGFIHSCRSYDKEWDFQTCAMWLRINGMGPLVISELFGLNIGTIQNKGFLGLLTLDYNNKNYKLCNTMITFKKKEKLRKIHESEEWLEGQKLNSQKLTSDPEWIKNQKAGIKKINEDQEFIKNRLKMLKSPEHAQRISAGWQHIPYEEWEKFASDSPYCPVFNEECRESNREKYDRKCFLTGLSEEKNITSTGKQQRLSVHHVDMDKGQGCNGIKWKLVPICLNWHGKVHTEEWESRITWLLKNVWVINETD